MDISLEEQRLMAMEALQEFTNPAFHEQRSAERKKALQLFLEENGRKQAALKEQWPFNFKSPSRQALLRDRLHGRFRDFGRFWVLLPLSWALCAWVFGPLPTVLVIASAALLYPLSYFAEYRRMKRERRDILLRMSTPEDQI